jgi:S1-C subfamily serine protease
VYSSSSAGEDLIIKHKLLFGVLAGICMDFATRVLPGVWKTRRSHDGAGLLSLASILIIAFNLFSPLTVGQQSSGQRNGISNYVYMIRIPETPQHAAAIQTGFRLSGTRGIVTALHGVIGGGGFSAINDKNEVFNNLRLGGLDIVNDIALLISEDARLQDNSGLLSSRQTIESGTFLRVLGHPLGINLHLKAVQTGDPAIVRLSRLVPPTSAKAFDRRQSPSLDARVLDIETPLVPGDSGAPVLDDAGAVVGVVDGGLARGQAAISWAMPLASVQFRPPAILQDQIAALARQAVEDLFSFEVDDTRVDESETKVWQLDTANPRKATFKGIVRGPDGRPLSGANVEARHYVKRGEAFGERVGSVVTNAEGEYEISVLPGGYSFVIHKPSYETKEILYVPMFPGVVFSTDDTLAAESPVVRRFGVSKGVNSPDDPKTARIIGRIAEYSGNPIAGAFVTVTKADDSRNPWDGRTVKTDSDGHYSIVDLSSELYDLTIEARGYRTLYLLGIPTCEGHQNRINEGLNPLRPAR